MTLEQSIYLRLWLSFALGELESSEQPDWADLPELELRLIRLQMREGGLWAQEAQEEREELKHDGGSLLIAQSV